MHVFHAARAECRSPQIGCRDEVRKHKRHSNLGTWDHPVHQRRYARRERARSLAYPQEFCQGAIRIVDKAVEWSRRVGGDMLDIADLVFHVGHQLYEPVLPLGGLRGLGSHEQFGAARRGRVNVYPSGGHAGPVECQPRYTG